MGELAARVLPNGRSKDQASRFVDNTRTLASWDVRWSIPFSRTLSIRQAYTPEWQLSVQANDLRLNQRGGSVKTVYLLHDTWTHYCKADWIAAHFPIDSFVIVKNTRPWFGKYLFLRARRLGLLKVFDDVLFRAYWLSC